MPQRSWLFPLLAVLLAMTAVAILGEFTLRLLDFKPGKFNSGYLQFGYPSGIPTYDEDGLLKEGEPVRVRLFQADPELLWAPIPGTEFTNSQGFRGRREFALPKPPGTFRILFLGDSCTFLGDPVYPEIVERELSRRFPGRIFESVNASVPGYSSFQGRRLLGRLKRWEPDVVCVYFGWNDHWPGQGGLTDATQVSLERGPRLLGLLEAVWGKVEGEGIPRVPFGDFQTNLEGIRDAVAEWKATPLFITAPTGFQDGAMPAWTYGFFGRYYHMEREAVQEIPRQHHAYADAVRSVASRKGSLLVDAEEDFRRAGTPIHFLFRKDMIHLREPGHERLGQSISTVLASLLERDAPASQDHGR